MKLSLFLVLGSLAAAFALSACGDDSKETPVDSCVFRDAKGTLLACYEMESDDKITGCGLQKQDKTQVNGMLVKEDPCPADGTVCGTMTSGEDFFVYPASSCNDWN